MGRKAGKVFSIQGADRGHCDWWMRTAEVTLAGVVGEGGMMMLVTLNELASLHQPPGRISLRWRTVAIVGVTPGLTGIGWGFVTCLEVS